MKKVILFSFVTLVSFPPEGFSMEKDLVFEGKDPSGGPEKRRKFNSIPHQQVLQDESVGITAQEAYHYVFKEEKEDQKIEELCEDKKKAFPITHHYDDVQLPVSDIYIGDSLEEEKKGKKPRLTRAKNFFSDELTSDPNSEKVDDHVQKTLQNNLIKSPVKDIKIDSQHPQLRNKTHIYNKTEMYVFHESNDQPEIESSENFSSKKIQLFSPKELQDLNLKKITNFDNFCAEKKPTSNRKEECWDTFPLSKLTKLAPNFHNKIVLNSTIRFDGDSQKNSIETTHEDVKENAVFKIPDLPQRIKNKQKRSLRVSG